MSIILSPIEARIIGCLMEKEVTTPDYYPLTANSLLSACNQKSSREPVMSLSQAELTSTLSALNERRLVTDESGFNARASKYSHRFCNTEFGDLQFSAAEKAVVCVLLLRGAQTPGELRSRCQRMHEFGNVQEVDAVLESLSSKKLVVQLPREPGKRESRYQHLFFGEVDLDSLATPDQVAPSSPAPTASSQSAVEVELLELRQEVADLREQLSQLQGQMDELKSLLD